MHLPNSDLLQRAHSVFPGASLGSFFLPDDVDFVATSAQGAIVKDHRGREYIDCVLGSGPMILGHAHPSVIAAVTQQIQRGTTYYAVNEAAVLLGEAIVSAVRCAEMVKFCGSGSEATFYALRMARAVTGRNKILKFEGAYHGHHDYTMVSTTPGVAAPYPAGVVDSAGIPDMLVDSVLIAPFNDLKTTLRIIREHEDDLAAVIVEPECRLIEPAPGFLQGLRKETQRIGALLIFDEVVTGFRVSYGGAQELHKVTPDLACFGKILGGGYPLAAVVGRKDLMQLTNPRQKPPKGYVYFSGTLSGNPVAATAGLATLRELSQAGAYDRLRETGDRFRNGLRKIIQDIDMPAQVVGSGSMANIFFTAEPIHDYRGSLNENKAFKHELRSELLRRGVLTHLAAKMYFSTMHTAEHIDRVLNAFDESLRVISKKAGR